MPGLRGTRSTGLRARGDMYTASKLCARWRPRRALAPASMCVYMDRWVGGWVGGWVYEGRTWPMSKGGGGAISVSVRPVSFLRGKCSEHAQLLQTPQALFSLFTSGLHHHDKGKRPDAAFACRVLHRPSCRSRLWPRIRQKGVHANNRLFERGLLGMAVLLGVYSYCVSGWVSGWADWRVPAQLCHSQHDPSLFSLLSHACNRPTYFSASLMSGQMQSKPRDRCSVVSEMSRHQFIYCPCSLDNTWAQGCLH
jgi:hypothetical protein